MEKVSKVTNVVGNGTWESKYGTMYRFEVSFENGDTGDYNSKSQDQQNFVVGAEAKYEITSKEINGRTFHNVKPVRDVPIASFGGGSTPNPNKDKKIARMSILKCVTDLVINDHIKFDQMLAYAKFYEKYVEDGTDVFTEMYAKKEEEKQVQQQSDLPF